MSTKLYISGPISGMPGDNKKAFDDTATALRKLGYFPLNPFDLDLIEEINGDWYKALKRDIRYLVDCDGILLLKSWEISKGARLEVHIAVSLDMPFYTLTDGKVVEIPAFKNDYINNK